MDYRTEYPHYFQALELYINRDLVKLKRLLKSSKLSIMEKNLLKARLLGLDSKWSEAIELLKNPYSELYLESQRLLMRGSFLLRKGAHEKSNVENILALEILEKIGDKKGWFNGNYHMAVNFSRLSLENLMKLYLEKSMKYAEDLDDIYSIKRTYLNFYSRNGEFSKAEKIMDEIIEDNIFEKIKFGRVLKNIMADIYFRMGKHDKALEFYLEMKKEKKSIYKARTDYEYGILLAIRNNTSLSKMPNSLLDSEEYQSLWKTLQALEDGDPFEANTHWNKLRKLNPIKYLEPFKFSVKGDYSNHFSQYLKKIKISNIENKALNIKKGSRMYKLYNSIRSSSIALRKEVLIEKVWGIEYAPEFDSRFYKLIERLKKNTDLNIVMENSTYRIVN